MERTTNQKKWYLKWWAIILWIIITILLITLIAFGFLVNNALKGFKGEEMSGASMAMSLKAQKKYNAEGVNNYWTGAKDPKVTIVEFADFQCPNCVSAYQKVREISIKYKDDVKIIFRDFPVYEGSVEMALAARCAGEQGLFWPMHDKLFQSQKNNGINQLKELAKQVGAKEEKFLSCMQEERYLPLIRKDYDDGQNFDVTGTPTFFINGYKIAGDIPRDVFQKIIEELIK